MIHPISRPTRVANRRRVRATIRICRLELEREEEELNRGVRPPPNVIASLLSHSRRSALRNGRGHDSFEKKESAIFYNRRRTQCGRKPGVRLSKEHVSKLVVGADVRRDIIINPNMTTMLCLISFFSKSLSLPSRQDVH